MTEIPNLKGNGPLCAPRRSALIAKDGRIVLSTFEGAPRVISTVRHTSTFRTLSRWLIYEILSQTSIVQLCHLLNEVAKL